MSNLNKKVNLTYVCMDSHFIPVYRDESGTLWKDVDPRSHASPALCRTADNQIESDVIYPLMQDKPNFIPSRKTW